MSKSLKDKPENDGKDGVKDDGKPSRRARKIRIRRKEDKDKVLYPEMRRLLKLSDDASVDEIKTKSL